MEKEFNLRLEKHRNNLETTYFKIYGNLGATKEDFASLLKMMKTRYLERSEELKNLDKRNKKWYLSRKMIGYMVYIDLFAGNLKKFQEKIPYLKELGITYVHLMPLLKPREGENDGGYAVEDYLDIDPNLGTKKDFKELLELLRKAEIDVCIDYVINHTSDTHEWAKKALGGDPYYQDFFLMFDDRTIPDQYDALVPEVLPNKAPGNFTYKKEIKKWVYTSFSNFQWDLNFKNPVVFEKMTDIMLQLANQGVNIIRLDAIPFMWKEVGTTCRNLPEIHDLIYMIHLIKDIVAPSLAVLGEAIVEPHEIFKYFGKANKTECDILYNANFMVNIWNSFATRDVRLLNIDNARFSPPENNCWMNYVRCHDDIGWGFNEEAINSFGMNPFYHKRFLINFFSGNFPGSFAKGEIYQYNEVSQDARINGTCASLLGLEKAIEENYVHEQEIAIKRIMLANALIFSHRGIPLIYSGDEIATLNDQSYLEDPQKKNEGRWVHRAIFDWERAEKRHKTNTFEEQIFTGIKKLVDLRKNNPLFDGDIKVHVVENSDIAVYTFYKQKDKKTLMCFFNFSEHIKEIAAKVYNELGFNGKMTDLFTQRIIDFSQETIRLAPYEFLWLSKTNFQ